MSESDIRVQTPHIAPLMRATCSARCARGEGARSGEQDINVPRPRKPRSGRRPRNAGGLQARSWHGSQFILPPVVQL